jgi:hypothetical protein
MRTFTAKFSHTGTCPGCKTAPKETCYCFEWDCGLITVKAVAHDNAIEELKELMRFLTFRRALRTGEIQLSEEDSDALRAILAKLTPYEKDRDYLKGIEPE